MNLFVYSSCIIVPQFSGFSPLPFVIQIYDIKDCWQYTTIKAIYSHLLLEHHRHQHQLRL
jgi:hypothetical protein